MRNYTVNSLYIVITMALLLSRNSFKLRGIKLQRRSFAYFNNKDAKQNFNFTLERQAYRFLVKDADIVPGTKILLCVSGGIDSMAMLHLLAKVRHMFTPNLELEVVTFNHKVRPESDEEVEFVKSVASNYGILTQHRILDESLRVEKGFQAIARQWRRKECLRILSSYQDTAPTSNDSSHSPPAVACIATAHHADDMVETMLLKFIRGVHMSHFTAMSARSDDSRFLKPLLFMKKSQIKEYMDINQFEWREDSSNLSRKYKRNEIRLDLIPLMEKLAGGETALKKRLSQLSSQSADLNKWIDMEAQQLLPDIVHYRSYATDEGVVHSAIIRHVTPKGKYFHTSNLVKMEIFDRICQNLTAKHLGVFETERSAEALYGEDDEKKGCFLSHEILTNLCEMSSQSLTGINMKSVHVNDHIDFSRSGDSIKIVRYPTSRNVSRYEKIAHRDEKNSCGFILNEVNFIHPSVSISCHSSMNEYDDVDISYPLLFVCFLLTFLFISLLCLHLYINMSILSIC